VKDTFVKLEHNAMPLSVKPMCIERHTQSSFYLSTWGSNFIAATSFECVTSVQNILECRFREGH